LDELMEGLCCEGRISNRQNSWVENMGVGLAGRYGLESKK